MTHRTLGVCYYPEHWPQSQWADDAALVHHLCLRAGLGPHDLNNDIRCCESHRFAFNNAPDLQDYDGAKIPSAGVHWEPL